MNNKLLDIYHGAHSLNDIKEAVDFIQNKYPNSKIYGVGISIGANFLTNYVGTEREVKNNNNK